MVGSFKGDRIELNSALYYIHVYMLVTGMVVYFLTGNGETINGLNYVKINRTTQEFLKFDMRHAKGSPTLDSSVCVCVCMCVCVCVCVSVCLCV